MATSKTKAAETTEEVKAAETTEATGQTDDREEIFVPRGYANDEPNLVIGVNGKLYVLPRGKTSKVPKAVAEEFKRSQKAQEALDNRKDALLEASK